MTQRFALFVALLALSCAQNNTEPAHRSIQVQVNKLQLQFQASSTKNATYQDHYQFSIDLGKQNQDLFLASFQYQSQDNLNQTQIQFTLQVKSLIEFNSTRDYVGDEKTIAKQWPLVGSSVTWQDWIDESKPVHGIPVYSYSATSQDGIFTVRVNIAPESVNVDKVTIGPNDVKMDFEIRNFPFSRNNTKLALQTQVTSLSQSENSGANALNYGNLAFGNKQGWPLGSFSWVPYGNSSSGGVDIESWTKDTGAESHFDIFFTFVPHQTTGQPTEIIWDPRVGLYYDSLPWCLGSLCGAAAVVVLVVIILVLVVIILAAIMVARKGKSEYQPIQ